MLSPLLWYTMGRGQPTPGQVCIVPNIPTSNSVTDLFNKKEFSLEMHNNILNVTCLQVPRLHLAYVLL
jgi:hypothetical protein